MDKERTLSELKRLRQHWVQTAVHYRRRWASAKDPEVKEALWSNRRYADGVAEGLTLAMEVTRES